MKNIIAVLFALASTSLYAQAFWIDVEPDTVSGGVFQTVLENEAYQVALTLPDTVAAGVFVTSRSPLTITFWSGVPAGWSILVFDDEEHTTRAFHLDFSGELMDIRTEQKFNLLERIKSYSP